MTFCKINFMRKYNSKPSHYTYCKNKKKKNTIKIKRLFHEIQKQACTEYVHHLKKLKITFSKVVDFEDIILLLSFLF